MNPQMIKGRSNPPIMEEMNKSSHVCVVLQYKHVNLNLYI